LFRYICDDDVTLFTNGRCSFVDGRFTFTFVCCCQLILFLVAKMLLFCYVDVVVPFVAFTNSRFCVVVHVYVAMVRCCSLFCSLGVGH